MASKSPLKEALGSPAASVVTRGRSQQAAAAAAANSPGGVSQLGAQLAGLGLADPAAPTAAVAWAVALKPPQSTAVLALDGAAEGGGAWREEGDGAAWLASKLLQQGWTGWICYNDEPPEGSGARGGVRFGHCKGVLAWSPSKLGWLVHSMPAWPAAFSDGELSEFAKSGVRCGQSFIWLQMRRTPELTRQIRDQIKLMNACVYAARVTPDEEAKVGFAEDSLGKELGRPYHLVPPSLIPLGPGLWHMAKDKSWGHGRLRDGRPTDLDFYEDALAAAPRFAGFWHVQSWLNGDVRPFGHTDHCDNILQVRLPDGAPYQTTRDHAKWGVHADRCLVVVGDLNRTQTQARRGGGGVIVEDERLWRALASLIHAVGAQHPQESPLASVDDFHATADSPGGASAVTRPSPRTQAAGGRGTRLAPAAAGLPGGRRGASTDAGLSGGQGDGSMGEGGSRTSAGSAAKPCRCQTGCSRGTCRCRRAGQPCSELCGCAGRCEHTAATAASSAAAGGGEAAATADTADSGSVDGTAGDCGAASAAKPCRCSTGCLHGRCGCRRAGRACTARCGCGGGCAASSADGAGTAPASGQSAGGNAEAAVEEHPPASRPAAAAEFAESAEPAEPAEPPAPAAPPAPPAPLAQLRAAVEEARLQVAQGLSAVLPFVQHSVAQHAAAGQAPLAAQVAAATAPHAEREARMGQEQGGEQRLADSAGGAAPSPASSDGKQPAAAEHCRCKKGCGDKRCPCRRASRACTPACGCSSADAVRCSNCAA